MTAERFVIEPIVERFFCEYSVFIWESDMAISATGRVGREQVVGDKAGANSEAVASTKLSSPRRLIGALENLGRNAWAALPTVSARGPQFAYSTSGDEKLPKDGYFPGISDEVIIKTEQEGGEVQEHQLPVLEEERDSRLNRQAPDVAAQSARVLAHDMQQTVERTSADGVARRGVEETHRGDGSIFDRAIDVVGRKWAAVGDAAEQAGLSEDEANAEANKAIGKIDPQANFSERRPVLSQLAAALRLSPSYSEQTPDTEQRRRPMLRPRLA